MYNVLVTHMYLPNKRSSLLLLHSRIPLIEYARVNTVNHCIREYIIRIRHPVSRYVSYSSLGVFVPALIFTIVKWQPLFDSK